MDLINELMSKTEMLDKVLKVLVKNGNAVASAERDYKIAVSKKALELRSQDMPVTLINQVIFGLDEISALRFIRDTAEVTYKANLESINILKLQIRVLESSIEREWGASK